jgi:hypothetical protein
VSYRDDQEALAARNVALERQVKDLELRKPAPVSVPSRRLELAARSVSSLAGIAGGTAAAIYASMNYWSVDYIWMGCVVAGVSAIAPFFGLRRGLRPFTLRATHIIGCADGDHPIRVIAVIHVPADADARARRDASFGGRSAEAKRIAGDMLEGVLRQELGAVDSATIRADGATVSARVLEHGMRALTTYGLAIDRVFVSIGQG